MNASEPQRILIVDDEIINLFAIVEALGGYGFDLVTAQNGDEALISARERRPDLILLDILMPGMDGFEACAQLKSDSETRDIPIIFLTGITETEQKLRAFQLGGVDYITKPFESREVLARVILHLDQHSLYLRLQQRLEAYEQAGLALPDDTALPADRAGSLAKVSNYLRENLAATPNLDELARIAATNRTTLNQDFQRLYCMSVFDWLREQRLLRAALLLRTTDRSVLDIANSVGYASHAGFTAAFRQRFGVSPKECRSTDVA
jgi:CheY-like chemotaxis protein